MDAREFITLGLERVRGGTLGMVKDLTPEQMAWRAGPEANSAGFLLFHIFRTADFIFTRVGAGDPQFWELGNWAKRWTLPPPPPDAGGAWSTGNSWTPAELGAFEPPPLDDLLGYGAAVYARGANTLKDMEVSRLDEEVRPNVTVAQNLLIAITHESQHNGQIDYLLGLMRTSA